MTRGLQIEINYAPRGKQTTIMHQIPNCKEARATGVSHQRFQPTLHSSTAVIDQAKKNENRTDSSEHEVLKVCLVHNHIPIFKMAFGWSASTKIEAT